MKTSFTSSFLKNCELYLASCKEKISPVLKRTLSSMTLSSSLS
ncbi:MAG: hypothetical protein SOZ42_03700 [Candidatus Enterosoma sp.]|nr:hypothetical protein [Candidatus Enterosoma sp.]